MIKSILFQKEFIPLIKSGEKIVTRRIKTNLKADDIVYFKAGRFEKKEGYIRICNVMKITLTEISGCAEEYEKEGFKGKYEDMFERFIRLWNFLNDKKGFRWEDNPDIYRIRFEYLGESLNKSEVRNEII